MWLGGARLTEIVFALLYALSLLGWAWALAPISRAAALTTALVLLVTPTYAGLFHEVSSDPVFAFVFAWWAGAVVRAWTHRLDGLARRRRRRRRAAHALPAGRAGRRSSPPWSCRSSPAAGGRPSLRGVAVCLAAAILPLAAWAVHNAVRYDDLTVARGSKAWVPFFRVGGETDPRERRRVASASPTPSSARCCRCRRMRSRDVDVETYFGGVGNLEVIRLIALSDRVFGWDDDYDVLFDASLESDPRASPAATRGGSPTRSGTSSRSVTLPRCASGRSGSARAAGRARRSTASRSLPRSRSRRSSRRCATASSGARPTTSSAASSPIRRRRSGARRRGGATSELVDTVRDWNAQLPTARLEHLAREQGRHCERPLARDRSSGSRSRRVALAVRRPRGTAPILVLVGSALVVLLVHALSQAPQSEFELPVRPRLDRGGARGAARAAGGAVVTRIEIDPAGARRARRTALPRARRQGRGVLPTRSRRRRRSPSTRGSRSACRCSPARRPLSARGRGRSTSRRRATRSSRGTASGSRRSTSSSWTACTPTSRHTATSATRSPFSDRTASSSSTTATRRPPPRPRRRSPRRRAPTASPGTGTATSTGPSSDCGPTTGSTSPCSTPTRAWPSSRAAPRDWRVALTVEEIERLGYAELDSDRVPLLGLRPASDLDELLARRSRSLRSPRARADVAADPAAGVRADRGRRARRRHAARAPRRHVPAQRARRRQASRLGAPRLDLQLARPRRPPALGEPERRRGRLRLPRPRRLLLVQGPRRPGPLRRAERARRDPDRAAAAAPPARRPRRPPRRRASPGSRPTPARSGWASRRRAGSPGRSGTSVAAGASS